MTILVVEGEVNGDNGKEATRQIA
jgi:hypothetical protein